MTGSALGATQDDQLVNDPTVPLNIAFSDSDAGANSDDRSLIDMLSDFAGLGGAFVSYELNSVLIRAEDRIAVINGERVRVGDKVGSATVASIEADQVVLNVDGEMQTLRRYKNSIKTPVKVTNNE